MKLLVLCVDGFDPQYASENGFDQLRHSASLSIPEECFIDTPEGPQAATGRVWPSILTGTVIDQGVTVRKGIREIAHNFLMRAGIRWSGKKRYRVNPWNIGLETVFRDRHSFTWNLPTFSPEWIASFPEPEEGPLLESLKEYTLREYETFKILARGLVDERHELGMVYTRYLDLLGHLSSTSLDVVYVSISALAQTLAQRQLAKGDHLMMISDHGCLDGLHTDRAYIGATFPFKAESILDIRSVIERVLLPRCLREGPCPWREIGNCSLDFGLRCPDQEELDP